jgi:hypothetical protein
MSRVEIEVQLQAGPGASSRIDAIVSALVRHERRQRRLSFLLWIVIVAFSALAFALTYHRCFGN